MLTLDPAIVLLDKYQKDCVHLLRETLEQAEKGNIHSLALIVVTKSGIGCNMAGVNASDLYFGAGRLMTRIQETASQGMPR